MKKQASKSGRLLILSFLAVIMCCYSINTNKSYAQGANATDKTGIFETQKLKPPMPSCPDEGILTSTYCDGGCALTGVPSSGGVFMCLSTDLGALGLDPNHRTCDGTGSCDAGNCQFLHIRNLTACTGNKILEIKITIKQDSPYTKFVICAPLTNYGTTQGGSHYDTLWNMTDLSNSTQITSEACNTWTGNLPRVIDFQDLGNGYLHVGECNEWTVIICGATITNVALVWPDGTSNFANPTVNTTKCPDANGNHGWPGC